MSEPSFYQPPLSQPPPYLTATQAKPGVVTVIGVLNLVFAGIGIIMTLWGLYVALVGNPFLKMTSGLPGMEAQIEAQLAMQERLKPMTLVSSALAFLVAVPMIIAGIQLLRSKANGLKWANSYGIFSLVVKVINLAMTLFIAVPAMQELTDRLMSGSGVPASARGIMSGSMIGGAIGGGLFSCVYPLLVLILLNRGAAKAWFATLAGKASAA